MSFSGEARKILTLFFGLAITAASFFFLYRTMQPGACGADHKLIYLFAGGIAFGMAFVLPSVFFDTAKKFVSLLPSIRVGGSPPSP